MRVTGWRPLSEGLSSVALLSCHKHRYYSLWGQLLAMEKWARMHWNGRVKGVWVGHWQHLPDFQFPISSPDFSIFPNSYIQLVTWTSITGPAYRISRLPLSLLPPPVSPWLHPPSTANELPTSHLWFAFWLPSLTEPTSYILLIPSCHHIGLGPIFFLSLWTIAIIAFLSRFYSHLHTM